MSNENDCYHYIRNYYSVPAYIGVRVKIRGKDGMIVHAKHSQHYLHVLMDGEKRSDVYHPTDSVQYVVVGVDGLRPAVEERVAADARLIAAAPDLLTALKEFIDWHGPAHDNDCPEDDTCDCAGAPINARVNAAIRNAEGVDA